MSAQRPPLPDGPGRPRRSLGQCFLTDRRIAQKIVALAHLDARDRVLEIGPGRGILTRILAHRAGEVIAVELDARLHVELEREFAEVPSVRIVRADALHFPLQSIPPPFVVVANLPYYLSTPMLFRLLQARAGISRMVLMLQREVVDRMAASPGTKAYGPLTLAVAYAAAVRKAFSVPASCFAPRPAVESAVVTVIPRSAPAVAVRNEVVLFRAIRAAFGHRRKVLSNALRDGGFSARDVVRGLDGSGIDGRRRGETLTLEEFGRLADALS